MAQTTTEPTSSREPHCPNCDAVLPPQAAFCASCGERIVKQQINALLQSTTDISTRYRITSLVRRRPHVSLFFALDNQQQRTVAIRDIDISELQDEARAQACDIAQHEYDLLRREHIPSLMPLIDLRYFDGHLYVISGWPTHTGSLQTVAAQPQIHTLHEVLQSGIGLPDVQRSMHWIEHMCLALEKLHRQQIVLGDLDPQSLILGGDNYACELILMPSWLPPAIRALLPRPAAALQGNTSNFSAPEVLLGTYEPYSDVYSLGAVLYLLLTGSPPEESMARMHRRLRPPAEVNPRVNKGLDDLVMKALALEGSERFQSAEEMLRALQNVRSGSKKTPLKSSSFHSSSARPTQNNGTATKELKIEEIDNIDTVLMTPLPEASLAAWQAQKTPGTATDSAPIAEEQALPTIVEGAVQHLPDRETEQQPDALETPTVTHKPENPQNSLSQQLKKRITGILPSISPAQLPKAERLPALTTSTPNEQNTADKQKRGFLKQLQRLLQGEQHHGTTAAATIETPLRVQPNQAYTIRIQLMGRNEPGFTQGVPLRTDIRKGGLPGGLSSLIEGELVHIEVRSALYQNFAYIVQQATASIPADGFAAEVTIPMRPLSSGPSGRRDRLHIFFMDEMRRPLYEKPFVIELFISHLVQPGREGHNVLTIPL